MRCVRPEQPKKIRTPEQEEKLRIAKERERITKERREREDRAKREARRKLFKPCPFCGGNLAEIPYPGDISVFVQCPHCDSTGPLVHEEDFTGDREVEAIRRWNERKQ